MTDDEAPGSQEPVSAMARGGCAGLGARTISQDRPQAATQGKAAMPYPATAPELCIETPNVRLLSNRALT